MTETAELADVVLPAQSWAEREGTFTSGERRVQRYFPPSSPWEMPARIGKFWASSTNALDWANRLLPPAWSSPK